MVDHYQQKKKILNDLLDQVNNRIDKDIELTPFLTWFELKSGMNRNSALKYLQEWSNIGFIGEIKDGFLLAKKKSSKKKVQPK